jgi:hypothetical protein
MHVAEADGTEFLEDPYVEGRVILKYMLKMLDVRAWTGLI